MSYRVIGIAIAVAFAFASVASAQIVQRTGTPAQVTNKQPPAPPPAPPPNYVIGPGDALTIKLWKQDEASGDVVVRPDGKITMPVGKDIVASGLTPEELTAKVTEEMKKFYEDPVVTIVVKQINSRNVFITGSVAKPGPYVLMGPMTVLQLITIAGGVAEFADKKNVMLVSGSLKDKNGQPLTYKINYDDMSKGKNMAKNNIELRPGDTVIVR
jgi:polysaccharide export outer membrane protein